MDGWCVVSEQMLVSILTVSIESCEMSLSSDVGLHEIKYIMNPVLPVILLGAWPELDWVSFP